MKNNINFCFFENNIVKLKCFFYFKDKWRIYLFNIYKKYINNKLALEKWYLTNNITELIHSKIIIFTRHIINQYNFIISLKRILIHNDFKNSDIIRKDFKTKSLLL